MCYREHPTLRENLNLTAILPFGQKKASILKEVYLALNKRSQRAIIGRELLAMARAGSMYAQQARRELFGV